MNIIDKIKLLFKANTIIKEAKKMDFKSGWKTSEFWVTLAGIISTVWFAVAGFVPKDIALYVIAGAVVVYNFVRGALKIAHEIVKVIPGTKDDELLAKIEAVVNEVVKPFLPKVS